MQCHAVPPSATVARKQLELSHAWADGRAPEARPVPVLLGARARLEATPYFLRQSGARLARLGRGFSSEEVASASAKELLRVG